MTSRPLAHQKALVTGASSGIGHAVAIALGEAGADVCVNYVGASLAAAREAVDRITAAGSRAFACEADVSDEAQVRAMFAHAIGEFGTLDILVNNAGVQQDASIDTMTLADWNRVIGINLTGQFLCAREAIREFKRRGAVPEVSRATGKIICISSAHEVIPWAGHVNYAASKGGVMMLMKTLAQEVAPHRIRVNSICPGAIQTPLNHAAWATPEALKQLLKLIPYGRIGQPEDIASVAVWLASDEADFITGHSLFVDGGSTLYPEFADGG